MKNSNQSVRSIAEEIKIGSMAVEMGLLDGQTLIGCIQSWTQETSKSFLRILIEDSGLESEDLSLVEALLDASRKSGSTARQSKETEGPAEPDILHFQSDKPGNCKERFQADRFLARGGLGVVFQGHDLELDRTVAIKELNAEYTKDPWAAERFHRESALTASLEHPSIVPIYGRGVRADGTPFYAMRMIEGRTLREVADQFHQPKKQRILTDRMEFRKLIGYLLPVSQAIEHAHSRGIVHRDLKPSNVIVGEHGETMLIDWGLARKIGTEENENGKLNEQVSRVPDHELTLQGTALGTLAYMSPEQARGEKTLTAATDIFGLGGILFYLLTGFPPRGGEDKKLQTEQASRGHIEDRLLQSQQVPRQLSAICRKALSIQPEERYISAASFARDLENFLAEEPVSACPESVFARTRRWARAHHALVTGAITTLIISFAAMGISLYLLAGKNEILSKAIADAQHEATEKEKARAAEEMAKNQVASQLQQIELVSDTVFEIFAEFDIRNLKEAGESVEAVLAKKLVAASEKLDEKAIADGRTLAKVRNRLGQTLASLGYSAEAIPLFKSVRRFRAESLDQENEHTLASLNNLAMAYDETGKPDLALQLYEESFNLCKIQFGPDHPETLTNMNNLAAGYEAVGKLDLALPLYEEAFKLSKTKLGPDHTDTLTSMSNLAGCYQDVGKLDLALPLKEEALNLTKAKFGPDHPHTLICMNSLAGGYEASGKLDLALPLYELTLKIKKNKLGPDHPETLLGMNNLAVAYKVSDRLDLAIPLGEEALELTNNKLGPGHPYTLSIMNNLAEVYQAARKLDFAIPLHEKTLVLFKSKLGPDHPSTLASMHNLGRAYHQAGKLDLALPLLEETLSRFKKILGPDHPSTLICMNNLAKAYEAAGKLDLAILLFEQAHDLFKTKLGPDHPHTITSMKALAEGYSSAKQFDLAIPLLEETQRLREQLLGRAHRDTQAVVGLLGVNYKKAGRIQEAIPLLEEVLENTTEHSTLRLVRGHLIEAYFKAERKSQAASLMAKILREARDQYPPGSPLLAGVLAESGLTLLDLGQFGDAEPLLRECVEIREKTQPDAWNTFNAKVLLGRALVGLAKDETDAVVRTKQLAEAEPLLVQGYEGMKTRENTIPPQSVEFISQAVDHFIDLYTLSGKPDEVKKWQAVRAMNAEPQEPPTNSR